MARNEIQRLFDNGMISDREMQRVRKSKGRADEYAHDYAMTGGSRGPSGAFESNEIDGREPAKRRARRRPNRRVARPMSRPDRQPRKPSRLAEGHRPQGQGAEQRAGRTEQEHKGMANRRSGAPDERLRVSSRLVLRRKHAANGTASTDWNHWITEGNSNGLHTQLPNWSRIAMLKYLLRLSA